MFKKINLFRILKNIFGTKKLEEKNTPVIETVQEVKKRVSMGGSRFKITHFTLSHHAKRKKNRIQGRARNINHKKAA